MSNFPRNVRGFDFVFKVVVVGESGVGKTSLVASFAEEPFIDDRSSTIGADIRTLSMTNSDKRVKCVIWDTAGQEKFRTLTGSFYRGAQIAILCFDVTNYDSFNEMRFWMNDIRTNFSTSNHVVKILVGTKTDKKHRVVSEDEARALAAFNECYSYIETSAKTGSGVRDVFEHGVSKVLSTPELLQTAPAVITLSTTAAVMDARRSMCC